MIWRDWAALEEAHIREPEILKSLYPARKIMTSRKNAVGN